MPYSKQTNPFLALGNLSLGAAMVASVLADIALVDDTQLSKGSVLLYNFTDPAKWLYLDPTSAAAVDNSTVFATKSGTGRWLVAPWSPGGSLNVANVTVTAGEYYFAAGATAGIEYLNPTATAGAQAGGTLTIQAQDAVAGSSVNGAAAGGDIQINLGDAARLNTGNANGGTLSVLGGVGIGNGNGGGVTLTMGAKSGTGVDGIFTVKAGGTSGTMALLKDSANAQRFLFDASGFMSFGDPAGAVNQRPASTGRVRMPNDALTYYRMADDSADKFFTGCNGANTFYVLGIPGGILNWYSNHLGVSLFQNYSHTHQATTYFIMEPGTGVKITDYNAASAQRFYFDAAGGYLSIGNPAGAATGRPAPAGTVRLPQTGIVAWSDSTNADANARIYMTVTDQLKIENGAASKASIIFTAGGEMGLVSYSNPTYFDGFGLQIRGLNGYLHNIALDASAVQARINFRSGSTGSAMGTGFAGIIYYAGDPNGVVTALRGSICLDSSGGGKAWVKITTDDDANWKEITHA